MIKFGNFKKFIDGKMNEPKIDAAFLFLLTMLIAMCFAKTQFAQGNIGYGIALVLAGAFIGEWIGRGIILLYKKLPSKYSKLQAR